MVRLVLGVMGPIGSGKDTFANYLKEKHGFFATSFGDTVRAELAALGIEETRENQQKLGVENRKKYGADYWAKKLVEKIISSGAELAVINGVRTVDDAAVPREAFGDKFKLVILDCPAEIRFARLKARKRGGDPETFEEFKKQEKAEFEKFKFSDTVKLADFTVKNDSTFEDFHKGIDKLVKNLLGP